MKSRIFFLVLLIMVGITGWLRPNIAWSVAGACASCHVMHAMVAGAAVPTAGGPQDFLMKNTCLGCHTGGAAVIPSATQAPMVLVTSGNELAGGNFNYLATGDNYGHNPSDLSNPDTLTKPPGWKTGFTNFGGGQIGSGAADGGWDTTKLSCDGIYGCHGNPTAAGIKGSHHNNPHPLTDGAAAGLANDPGTGYRFLSGIMGWEEALFEWGVGATPVNGEHNVYYSEARTTDVVSNKQTISYFCAECHGIFHSGAGDEGLSNIDDPAVMGSPWIRHPVDISMGTTAGTEYAHYTAYKTAAPVGSSDTSDGDMTVANATDRIVMCLSCHRAHASAYPASLRWQYTTIVAGTPNTNGCFICHGHKDGDLTND